MFVAPIRHAFICSVKHFQTAFDAKWESFIASGFEDGLKPLLSSLASAGPVEIPCCSRLQTALCLEQNHNPTNRESRVLH